MKLKNKLEVEETLEVGVLPNAPTNNFSVIFETVGMFQRRQVGNIINKNDTDFLPSVSNSFPTSVFAFNVSTTNANPNLTVSFVNQVAGTVFAAPQSLNGTPAFRMLQDSDLSQTSLGNKQNALTAGDHIDITTDVISVKPTLGVFMKDSGDNDRILMSSVSSGTNHNDMVIKQISSDGFLKLRNAQDEDFFVYRNSTQEVMMPLVGVSTGTSSNILTMGSNGAIWKSNRTIGDFALASSLGNYLEKASLAVSPVANWDTIGENRIVHSTSSANSPYNGYGVGMNFQGSTDNFRGQLFFNTSSSQSSIQYRTANTGDGWSAVKTVWDDSNLVNPATQAWVLTQIPTIPTNYITTDTNQTGLSGDKETNGFWHFKGLLGSPIALEKSTATNLSIRYINVDGDVIFAGLANGSTYAIGGSVSLNTVANRWMWVDSSGLVGSQNGFSKTGATNADVLLAGGGHRPVSDFALASSIITPNNGLLTISTSSDLTGGGTFSADQATASNVNIGLSAGTLSNIQLGVTANGWGNHSGLYLEKTALNLSPASAWDTLNENRIVYSASSANSPYTGYGVGINLYGASNMQGQLFINTSAGGDRNLQFRAYNTAGWSVVKTVWDDSNFNPADYVPTSRTLTINGTTFDLSQNRTWNIPDNDTITRLRGTATGTYTSGDLTLLEGTEIGITQSGSDFTITNTAPNATHTGEVTGSTALTIVNNAITTNKIANNNVTLAKLQNVPGFTLLGKGTAGSGNVGLVNIGATLRLVANELNTVDDFLDHFISTPGTYNIKIESKKTNVNIASGIISGTTINVEDGRYDGDELSINGCNEWSVTAQGSLRNICRTQGNFNLTQNSLFWWSATQNLWIQVI